MIVFAWQHHNKQTGNLHYPSAVYDQIQPPEDKAVSWRALGISPPPSPVRTVDGHNILQHLKSYISHIISMIYGALT